MIHRVHDVCNVVHRVLHTRVVGQSTSAAKRVFITVWGCTGEPSIMLKASADMPARLQHFTLVEGWKLLRQRVVSTVRTALIECCAQERRLMPQGYTLPST